MTRSVGTVVFSHGKESGPWGSKITAMAAVVRDLGSALESVDYRGLDDPGDRVRKLVAAGGGGPTLGTSNCAWASSRRLSPNCSPQRLPMASNPAPSEAM